MPEETNQTTILLLIKPTVESPISNISQMLSVLMIKSSLIKTVCGIGVLKSVVNQNVLLLLSSEILTGEVKESLLMTKSIA